MHDASYTSPQGGKIRRCHIKYQTLRKSDLGLNDTVPYSFNSVQWHHQSSRNALSSELAWNSMSRCFALARLSMGPKSNLGWHAYILSSAYHCLCAVTRLELTTAQTYTLYTLLFGTDMQHTKTNIILPHLTPTKTDMKLPGFPFDTSGTCSWVLGPHFLAHIYKNQRCQSSRSFVYNSIGRIKVLFLLVSGFVDNTDCHRWKIACIYSNRCTSGVYHHPIFWGLSTLLAPTPCFL